MFEQIHEPSIQLKNLLGVFKERGAIT